MRLIWNKSDGTCNTTVFSPAWQSKAAARGMTDNEWIAERISRIRAVRPDLATATVVLIEDESAIDDPQGFGREVWGHGAKIDMNKARAIHMDRIRVVRNAELAKEDVTFMRSVEDADTDAQATIKTKKQTLRDIPATFDITTDVNTLEKLEAKWPTELPARE